MSRCLAWLGDFSARSEACVKFRTEELGKEQQYLEQSSGNRERMSGLQDKAAYLKSCFEQEYGLAYVDLPEECTQARQVRDYLSATASGMDRNDINSRLNQVYFENRGFLND